MQAAARFAAPASRSVMLARMRPRPASRAGLSSGRTSFTALAGPRPEQGVAFPIFVVEQVRVDRRVEGGIVELEREVIAALFRALRPGRPDLRSAHIDAVAGRVVVGPVSLGDDADALGLQAQGDDLALEIVADLLEGTDVGHVTS